jgi:hypothetical protein
VNIALPAIVVFLLLLPGFIARSRIKYVERQLLDYSPFGVVVAGAIVWAAALHALWLSLARLITGRTVDVAALIGLISSDAPTQRDAIHTVATDIGWPAVYLSSLLLVAFVLPVVIRLMVVRFRLDRAESSLRHVFRFHDAPWYYLLTGADFVAAEKPDLIAISAVVNIAGTPMLYTGMLDEFFPDQDGKLDRLVLQQVMRRPFADDKAQGVDDAAITTAAMSSRFYPVDGDCFVLRYAEAITLNVQYIRLKPVPPAAAALVTAPVQGASSP